MKLRPALSLLEAWGLRDCRAAAAAADGAVATSAHGVRVDYVWASARALERFAVARVAHVALAPQLTDHALVVCDLRERATPSRAGAAPGAPPPVRAPRESRLQP